MSIIVAVIGGSGFLGQHLVRELQLRCNEKPLSESLHDSTSTTSNYKPPSSRTPNIEEIRVLDIVPFKPDIEIKESPPIMYNNCDVTKKEDLVHNLTGVTVVFHCAAVKPSLFYATKSYDSSMSNKVNLEGTKNVIWACQKLSIRALVYTSTMAAVLSGEMIVDHTETTSPKVNENNLIFGEYGRVRRHVESVVLQANGSKNQDGTELKTIALQPFLMYGEGDKYFIPEASKFAMLHDGHFPSVGHSWALFQLAYVGNVAFCHVLAMENLLANFSKSIDSCAGLPVYVNDDNMIDSPGNQLSQFLCRLGVTVGPSSTASVPFIIIKLLSLRAYAWICKSLGGPDYWIDWFKLQERVSIGCVTSRMRANLGLEYEPKYSNEKAINDSLKYYKLILNK